MSVVRFPSRHAAAVWLIPEPLGGWLVVARSHGWLFGSRREAMGEAQRLAASFHFPIREVAQ